MSIHGSTLKRRFSFWCVQATDSVAPMRLARISQPPKVDRAIRPPPAEILFQAMARK
jgi:hypothetical protein